jgi:uncharacterized protein (TIGR02118 family)
MLNVMILYPRGEGKKFEKDYYKTNHIALLKERLEPLSVEIEFGSATMGMESPYFAVTHLRFKSIQHLAGKYFFNAHDLTEDQDKFTNIKPVYQVGEIEEA